MLVKWSDELSVGVPSLDEQHRGMVTLLNQLHDGMMTGKDRMVLGDVLKQLLSATTVHFRYEEEVLARSSYPDAPAHAVEHAELSRQLQGIRRQYETIGPGAISIPVMSFLKNWLTSHIRGADMRYRGHLVAKGIR